MSHLLKLADLLEQAAAALREADKAIAVIPTISGTPISTLSARARRCLRRLGVKVLEDAAQLSYEDLEDSRGCGATTKLEIHEALQSIGLGLKGGWQNR